MLSHNNVFNLFKTNFELMLHYNMSLAELQSMTPWEHESHVALLANYLKELKQKQERQ